MRGVSGFRQLRYNSQNDVIVKFIWRWCVFFFFFFVKFSYWSKFLVNIITGSGVMIVFVYKGLTSILEIGNPPSEVCPTSVDWDESGSINLARMSLIKSYWILQNAWYFYNFFFKITTFAVSEWLRKKQHGLKLRPTTQIRVKISCTSISVFSWSFSVALFEWLS